MVETPIQLLQVTDLHLVAEADGLVLGVKPLAELAQVLAVALQENPKPDLIVATGDLSEDGSKGSYRLLREVLVATGLPTYVVPGNHDSASTLKKTLLTARGESHFARRGPSTPISSRPDLGPDHLASAQEHFRHGRLGGEVRWDRVIDLGGWRLVFLDSCVEGMPHGLLAAEELRTLSVALREMPSRPVLLSLHHGPVSDCPGYGCCLRNADELLTIARSHSNLRAILSGHAHLELERQVGQTRVLVTPSTCVHATHPRRGDPVDADDLWASHSVDPSRHGYRTIRLMANGDVQTKVGWVQTAR